MNNVIELPLDALAPDEAYQPRSGLDEEHLERLRCSDVADWPPLLVSPADEVPGGYFLIDGFHRYQVAKERQLQTVRCTVIPDAGYEEAFAANLKHGLPLSMQDRKEYAKWLGEHSPEMSTREIAHKAGLSQSTVSQITSRLIADNRTSSGETRQDDAEPEAEERHAASCASELAACRAENQRLQVENQQYQRLLSILAQKRTEGVAPDESAS